jgi:hypothetical protein
VAADRRGGCRDGSGCAYECRSAGALNRGGREREGGSAMKPALRRWRWWGKWVASVAAVLIVAVWFASGYFTIFLFYVSQSPPHLRPHLRQFALDTGRLSFQSLRSLPAPPGSVTAPFHRSQVSWAYMWTDHWRNVLAWRPVYANGAGSLGISIPLMFPALAAAGLAVWLWRTDRELWPGSCTQCGYDLSATASGACPECGAETQMSTR